MNSTARILVVDDNQSLVQVTRRLLQKEGFQVFTAFDGRQGLETARRERPDLVILDVVMPELDGYQVCRLLQADVETAAIPVLMLTVKGNLEPDIDGPTANSRMAEQMAGFEAGAVDFLTKPVAANELLTRVKSILWFEGFQDG